MQHHRRRIRLLRRLVLGLAVAAVAAPAAQAVPDAGTNATLPNGAIVQGEYKSGLGDGSVRGHPGGAFVQGERKADLPQGEVPGGLVQGERKVDLPQGEVPGGLVQGERKVDLPHGDGVVRVEVPRSTNTFDWGDALIVAGGAFALLLLAGGAALATRNASRPAAA